MRRLIPVESAQALPSPYPDLVFPEPPAGRPYIFVNMAMTLDGRAGVGNPRPGQTLSGSAGDRRGMAELRAASDAVLVGAGTVRAEDPVLRVRDADLCTARIAAGRPEQPCAIVLTTSGSVPPDARLLREPGVIFLTGSAGRDRMSQFGSGIEWFIAGDHEVDLQTAVAALRDRWGIARLLVEGGPHVTGKFLGAGLVDELFLTIAPVIRSGHEEPTVVEGPAFPFPSLPRFSLVSLAEDNGELYLRLRSIPSPGGEGR